MDLMVVEQSPAKSAKSSGNTTLIGENYNIMLKESIERFLEQCRKPISDFSGFRSIFFRLLQSRVDPPLETIWFYAAVSFRSGNVVEQDHLARVSKVRDLFQLIVSCLASCDGFKSVALLSPVLFELNKCVVELLKKKLPVGKEIECLIEGIVSYVSLFGGYKCSYEEDLVPEFANLVRVWTVDCFEKESGGRESLKMFFSLVSDEIKESFGEGRCVVGYLAGVVSVEAFLLRLCLKFHNRVLKSELEKELRIWAVGFITGCQSCYFFDILLKLLLEPTLPVNSLLDSEDEVLLRKVLYDVVILVDYSFLNSEESEATSYIMKNLDIIRLNVIHEAIQVTRDNGDHSKAISYTNAFCRSHLPSKLIKWVANQIGMEDMASKPNVITPQAFINWLLNLEGQGVRVFDKNHSKLHAKLLRDASRKDFKNSGRKKLDGDLFFIDANGRAGEERVDKKDQEMGEESMDAAFMAAAHTIKLTGNEGRLKRKGQKGKEETTRAKLVRYHLHNSSEKELFAASNDDSMSSESEVEDPLSDEDTDEMEK